jgi:DNA-binding NtrC family response regulator
MQNPVILFVEDDESLNTVFSRLLERNGFRVRSFTDGAKALKALDTETFDAAVFDVNLGASSGFDLLAAARKLQPASPVVMITASGSVNDAVRAIKGGAFDYLTKPVHEKEIVVLLGQALAANGGTSSRDGKSTVTEMLGESEPMRRLRNTIALVAAKNVPVFITGETGTGKELAARLLHSLGSRPKEPFIALNCAALPESLFESELFGHGKGAFTGAQKDRKGRLEAAGEGTIFLDEVTEMPLALQTKLLRVVQEREFEPVGSNAAVKILARFVAASNRDPEREIRAGRFREDLFYRLNVYPVRIPPLRERKEDIPLLVKTFAKSSGFGETEVAKAAMDRLLSYDWPGNVRELQNAVQFALISSGKSLIDEVCLPEKLFSAPAVPARALDANDQERREVLGALKDNSGNQTKAARSLGLTRAQLLYKMKKLGITPTVDYE